MHLLTVEAAEGKTAHTNGWNRANGMALNRVFDLFDTIPPIPLRPLPRARPPQLRCHQPPVLYTHSQSSYILLLVCLSYILVTLHTYIHDRLAAAYMMIESACTAQEVGCTLIGEDGLVVMAGAEWYQVHGFHVFDAIRSIPAIITSHPSLSSLHWCTVSMCVHVVCVSELSESVSV